MALICIFLVTNGHQRLFICLISHLYMYLCKIPVVFYLLSCKIKSFVSYIFCKYFLLDCGLPIHFINGVFDKKMFLILMRSIYPFFII